MCEWVEEPEEWWAQNLFDPEKSALEALSQPDDLNSWPVLDQAFQPELLPFSLDDELGSFTQDDFVPPELHLDFQAESNPHTLLNNTVSYDGQEDSSQRCAFKESFINASRSQTPLGSLSPQQSESTPSSSSMIAIVEQSPSPVFPYSYTEQEHEGIRDGVLGLQGCESSTNLRQFLYKLEPRSGSPNSKLSSQGSDVGEVSDAESDLPDEGYKKIDLLCKDETLGSDSDDPMCDVKEEMLLTPPSEMHHMEFIPVSNPQDRFCPCNSVTTSVGSKKGSFSSKIGKEGEVKDDPRSKEKVMSLTEKLLIALSTSSRGPVSQKDLEGTNFKLLSNCAQIKPASKVKSVKRKPPLKIKRETTAKREEGKVDKVEISEIKVKKEFAPEVTTEVKNELLPEAVQEAPVRRRAGRPKKLTPAGAQFKSSQGVKRRRPSSAKASPASNGLSCSQCSTHVTPVWRVGPDGPKTLCNACGVRYMKIAKSKRKCENKGVENQ